MAEGERSGVRRHLPGLIISVAIAVLTASSAPWWWPYFREAFGGKPDPPSGVVGFSGGCDSFRVHAQNRWLPYGARKLAAPDALAAQVGSFSPNQIVAVDGWVHGSVAYPFNPAPYNNNVWYHVADDTGWVSFAAVRAFPTEPDTTLRNPDGGTAAAVSADCEGSIQ